MFLPRFFASYIAISALMTCCSGGVSPSELDIPTLADITTLPLPIDRGFEKIFIMSSTKGDSLFRVLPSANIINSSPPYLPKVIPLFSANLRRAFAISLSRLSPTSWP